MPLVNLVALNGTPIGTIALTRVPMMGEYIQVHVPQRSRNFMVTRVMHFPPNPATANYVDAEIQVNELL
jgi:hypothetical protein